MSIMYRYILEKGSKKHTCINCNKKAFVKYIDTTTNDYLPNRFGRCDRESKCGYFLKPDFKSNLQTVWNKSEYIQTTQQNKPIFHIPSTELQKTQNSYNQNTFIQNLLTNIKHPFTISDIEKVIAMYQLGTINKGYYSGANTFPFMDVKGNIRAIQVKTFDKDNHTLKTNFIHSIIEKEHTKNQTTKPSWLIDYNKNEKKVSCLFGEHLLSKYPNNTIALVEAPKTAIYGTLYFGYPEQKENLLWLAVYNLSSLNVDKCKALQNRNVILFPDLSKDGKAFELWQNKAIQIQNKLININMKVSDYLEKKASINDKIQGKDLADYLINFDWRTFRT